MQETEDEGWVCEGGQSSTEGERTKEERRQDTTTQGMGTKWYSRATGSQGAQFH